MLIWNLSCMLNHILEYFRFTMKLCVYYFGCIRPKCLRIVLHYTVLLTFSAVKVRGSRSEVSWDQDLRVGTEERVVHDVAAEQTGHLPGHELCSNWRINGGSLLPSSAPILFLQHPGELGFNYVKSSFSGLKSIKTCTIEYSTTVEQLGYWSIEEGNKELKWGGSS